MSSVETSLTDEVSSPLLELPSSSLDEVPSSPPELPPSYLTELSLPSSDELPSPPLELPPTSLTETSKMKGLTESVPLFSVKKDNLEDSTKYLKTINFIVEEKYSNKAKALVIKRLVFRARLRDETLRWYQRLNSETRGNWDSLAAEFLVKYPVETRTAIDPNIYFN